MYAPCFHWQGLTATAPAIDKVGACNSHQPYLQQRPPQRGIQRLGEEKEYPSADKKDGRQKQPLVGQATEAPRYTGNGISIRRLQRAVGLWQRLYCAGPAPVVVSLVEDSDLASDC